MLNHKHLQTHVGSELVLLRSRRGGRGGGRRYSSGDRFRNHKVNSQSRSPCILFLCALSLCLHLICPSNLLASEPYSKPGAPFSTPIAQCFGSYGSCYKLSGSTTLLYKDAKESPKATRMPWHSHYSGFIDDVFLAIERIEVSEPSLGGLSLP